ncbi:MAG TPA: hypothetical protein VM328_11945 [Fimbriimonadaceae bacterium]|nr:hypothetical protein [Fimbriimonadaceae bacterium]
MALRDLQELQRRADALSREEQLQLANYLLTKAQPAVQGFQPNGSALMRYFGKIDFKGDPVEIQRKMRAEWPA